MKQIILRGCVLAVLLITLSINVVAETKFSDNEAYYEQLCNTYATRQENKTTCDQFESYLKSKKNALQNDLDQLKKDMNNVKGDLSEDNAALNTIHEKAQALKTSLVHTQEEIERSKEKIKNAEEKIAALDLKITEKDEQVRAYMVNMQGSERVNSYIGFIMGATDFNEASRRLAGVSLVNESQLEIVRQLSEDRKVIEAEKVAVSFEHESLSKQEEAQQVALKQQDELLEIARQKVAALEAQYEAMSASQEALLEQQRVTQEKLTDIGNFDLSSSGMARPISSGFYISASQWAYPYDGDALDGKKHLGADFAASVGTPLRAPAAGIVIAVNDGCATSGSFGCGSGFGNYMLMIVTANNQVYGVLYAHIQKNSYTVSVGQRVSQGQHVANVGNSGNSYGAHAHIETYYLGNDSVNAAYERWYQRGSNLFFNTYGTSSSLEPSTRCANNGNTAPCRLVTETVYGVKLKQRY